MKFIGQHIVDLIARFRSDVYLDSPTAGDSDPDRFLAIDTNKKIVYRTGTQLASDIGAANTDTTYSISCVDGDNSDEEKIRLTEGGSGSGTDDVVLEAGTGLSIARSGDKITFTNTVSDTNTQLSNAEVRSAVEAASDSNVFTDADHSKLNAIEASADVTDATNVAAAGALMDSDLLDEDNMSTNSATKPASQQSIKAYADRPTKAIKVYHANFKDNMGTTEHFIPLAGVPDEQTGAAKEQTVVIMPCAGAVKEIILRMHWSSTITTSDDITWKTYVRTKEKRMNGSGSVSGTFTMTNPTQGASDDNNTRSSGEITHAFAEGDAVSISMQWANTGPTNSADRIYVTVVMEMDYNSFGY